MAWILDNAVGTLRTLLGDGETDHFEFKAEVTPTPDGFHTQFYCGRTRVVEDSFEAFINGAALDDFDLDADKGVITVEPAVSGVVLCSYYYQWFQDVELAEFLMASVTQLSFTGLDDPAFPAALRSVSLDLACAYAFTRKAAEFMDSISASSPDGYSIEPGKQAPNWAKLASDALNRAKIKWQWFLDSPLGRMKPSFAFGNFCLPVYTPRN